jgi:AAA domain
MFFKKGRNGTGSAASVAAQPAPRQAPLVPAVDHAPLAASDVHRPVTGHALGFMTTADLEPNFGLIGQDRALRAIEFGTLMTAHDYNIFVLGPAASGKRTAVKAYVEKLAAQSPSPPDWVYLNDFNNQNRPKAVSLPPGRARALQQGMIGAIDELRATLPALFEGDDYQARRALLRRNTAPRRTVRLRR